MYPIPQLNLVVLSPTTPGHVDPHPSIEPSDTEPYYTRSVWHVEECRCTQVRCSPLQSNLVVQSPTTPGQFDPPSPPSIEPNGTEPYYTRSVWHVEECRHTHVRCTPNPSVKPSGIELYYTRSVWHVEECRCTQVRCTPHPSIKPSGTEYRALLHQVSLTPSPSLNGT